MLFPIKESRYTYLVKYSKLGDIFLFVKIPANKLSTVQTHLQQILQYLKLMIKSYSVLLLLNAVKVIYIISKTLSITVFTLSY